MAKEKEISQRDLTLINVLERLSDQIQQYELHLEEIDKRQSEISESVERAEQWRLSRQDRTDAALDTLQKEFLRYRSDMLSIVREQDHLDERMKGMAKLQEAITREQEGVNRNLKDMGERYNIQEKTAREHFEFSVRHGEMASKEIADSDHHITKLHMDTEKHLIEEHKENKRQLDSFRNETLRRLLALDGIETALQVLMVRTEPPEKKPFLFVRIFRWIVFFFRYRIPGMFKKEDSH